MKTLRLSLFAAALFLGSFAATAQTSVKKAPATAQASAPAKASDITWKEDVYDFGDLEKGKPASHEFTFKNTTNQTVIITKVKPSCGCTAANYTKTPIKPGETGSITATYNAAKPGSFNKQITVTTSDSEVNKVLRIKGKVVTDDTAAPAKAKPTHS